MSADRKKNILDICIVSLNSKNFFRMPVDVNVRPGHRLQKAIDAAYRTVFLPLSAFRLRT